MKPLVACAALVALSLVGGLSAAAVPAPGDDRAARGARGPTYDWHVLTPGPERITLHADASGQVRLTGRTPRYVPAQAWNRRQVFTDRRTDPTVDQMVCATWSSQSEDDVQQGLAVRVDADPGGRQRAVTLTKNTFAGYYWVFNLLTWDTDRVGDPWRYVAQFDMEDVVVRDGQWVPLPWRACLRVRGTTVRFKVWLPDREPEPSWHDRTHVRQATLSPAFVLRGRPGWYVGHLPPGATISYTDLVD